MGSRRRCNGARGFTLIEVLVVVAIIAIALLIGAPKLFEILRQQRFIGNAQQATALMRQARAEAVRRGVPAGVTQRFAERDLVAFVDADADGTFSAGDRVLPGGIVPLGTGVDMYGPADDYGSGVREDANVGFPETVANGPGTVLFNNLGAANAAGAFRFVDTRNNYLEVRVATAASGRIVINKFREVETGDTNDPDNWKARGEGGQEWQWD